VSIKVFIGQTRMFAVKLTGYYTYRTKNSMWAKKVQIHIIHRRKSSL